jgi:hypothetical protein
LGLAPRETSIFKNLFLVIPACFRPNVYRQITAAHSPVFLKA